jgi:hypothetical protein
MSKRWWEDLPDWMLKEEFRAKKGAHKGPLERDGRDLAALEHRVLPKDAYKREPEDELLTAYQPLQPLGEQGAADLGELR